jgi:hypothetical protein
VGSRERESNWGMGAGGRGPVGERGMTSGSRVWVVWMKEINKG